MSSPYIYAPDTNPQYTNGFYHTPFYYHTPRIHTPFLPTPAQSTSTTALPPVTPTTAHRAPFPDYGYVSWNTRPRRPSGHGLYSTGFHYSSNPPFPGPQARRHSFSAPSYHPPPQPQSAPWSAPPHIIRSPQPIILNPWIDGSSPRQDLHFDLAITAFTPLRFLGPGQSAILSAEETREVATHPPLRRLRIVCDLIPNWPIDLEFRQPNPTPYSPYSPNQVTFRQQPTSPPITLLDVLVAIHQAMHCQITREDWERLGEQKKRAITMAYTNRCNMSGHERSQGVKRVDFLLGKTRMVGLVRSGIQDGREVMRLVVADRYGG